MTFSSLKDRHLHSSKDGFVRFVALSLTFLLILSLLRILEIVYNGSLHGYPVSIGKVYGLSVVADLIFWFKSTWWLLLIFLPVFLIHKRTAAAIYITLVVLLCIIHLALVQYFSSAMVPLGADFYGYSMADIKQTVGASGGVKPLLIITSLVLLAIIIFLLNWLPRRLRVNTVTSFILAAVCLLVVLFKPQEALQPFNLGSEFVNNLAINKTDFFLAKSCDHFFPEENEIDIYADSYIGDYGDATFKQSTIAYVDEDNYPFLHTDSTPDVLSPFFRADSTPPNFVIILVEGLGRAFTNEGAYLGSFTPFLDSLSQQSLYWENFLSAGGRTFAVLPSLLGSLPFAKNGFSELGEKMPPHLSLLSLMKLNGYTTSFYYGGDAKFDNMNMFLRKNSTDKINDISSFPVGYTQMPAAGNATTWGYGDKELFRYYLQSNKEIQKPTFNVILTVSTHSPFAINEQQTYLDRFEQRMQTLGMNDDLKKEYRNYKSQYASILFTDDALRNFFAGYSKRSDFGNTIFLVTGDHRMPEIPMRTKIDRYHVPLIVYSPLLQRTAKFSSVSTHFDIAPSLLAFMKANYKIKTPTLVSWIGTGLDTARTLQNMHAYPLMQTKNDLVDFVMGSNMINGESLFQLNQNLTPSPFSDQNKYDQLKGAFDQFKKRNNKVSAGAKMIPDTIYQRYFPH